MQEQYQKLAYEVAVYREQLSLLQRELDRITLASLDLSNAAKTCSKLQTGEALIPVGGGAYLKSEVADKKLIVPIGAGYSLEMDQEKAEKELKRRIESTENAMKKMTDEYTKIAQRFQENSVRLREIEAQLANDKRVNENIREDYL